MEKENITKELRGAVKGDGTFAELYGSYYKLIAPNLWEFICDHPEVKAHLESKGITTYPQYEKVVEKAEKSFWGKDMFHVHDMWRKAMYEKYQKECKLQTLTGFVLSAPMSRNNSFNGAPQGDAAHALFWIINQLQKKAEELNWESVLIGEIHDSHIWSVHPREETELDYWTWYYTSVAIQKHWEWISLPLVVEKEVSDINGTWANMYDCGVLDGQLAKPKEKD